MVKSILVFQFGFFFFPWSIIGALLNTPDISLLQEKVLGLLKFLILRLLLKKWVHSDLGE